MPRYPFETWDVFTDRRFAGNPLAIVTDAERLSLGDMQTIAREFNLAETVFVLPPENQAHAARLRIFTPAYEMAFAGHPTVGAAIALARARGLDDRLTLELNAGLFPVRLDRRGAHLAATFENPNVPAERGPAPPPAAFEAALRLPSGTVAAGPSRPRRAGAGVDFYYIKAALDAVRRARIDSAAWERLDMAGVVGVLLYAEGGDGPGVTHHVRMFAPDAGVVEDPATGSAACALPAAIALAAVEAGAPLADGPHRWRVEQGVEMGRPSLIEVGFEIMRGNPGRVSIGGVAVPVTRGEIDT